MSGWMHEPRVVTPEYFARATHAVRSVSVGPTLGHSELLPGDYPCRLAKPCLKTAAMLTLLLAADATRIALIGSSRKRCERSLLAVRSAKAAVLRADNVASQPSIRPPGSLAESVSTQ